MAIARDEELAEWPRAPDLVREALGELVQAVLGATKDESRERREAMTAVLECQAKIIAALRVSPTLN